MNYWSWKLISLLCLQVLMLGTFLLWTKTFLNLVLAAYLMSTLPYVGSKVSFSAAGYGEIAV